MKFARLNKENFIKVLEYVNVLDKVNVDFLFDVYEMASDGIEAVYESNMIHNIQPVNPTELVFYVAGEYLYSLKTRTMQERVEFESNENIKTSMATVVADKYISLSHFNFKEGKVTSTYLPPMSSLNLYLNFILNILNSYKKNDPKSTLITDLLVKSISLSRCILNLLIDGYETEAFSTWRTLHECECTLMVLEKYGDDLIEQYLKHMKYGIAYKNLIPNKEEVDNIFVQIKSEMKAHDLKSKDMKKFIEYGWLYSVPEVNNVEGFKLNFRDGLEKIAGLEQYSKRYENSSELIHSTPLLFYANKQNYYYLSLLSLYESFFRLEKVFVSLFSKRVGPEALKKYSDMRNVYYVQLLNIHKIETNNYRAWQSSIPNLKKK